MAAAIECRLVLLLLLSWQLWGMEDMPKQSSQRLELPNSNHAQAVHIVYLGGVSETTRTNNVDFHKGILQQAFGSAEAASSSILYSYTESFNGFAATLADTHAEMIRGIDGVVSVFLSETIQVDTTDSWEYLGLSPDQGIWPQSGFGNGTIIGLVDSGIWPESESFKDDGLGPIPSRWKGSCVTTSNFAEASCNKKLIGAKFYSSAREAGSARSVMANASEYQSPRDYDGHGTHTSSTAAGRRVANASFQGVANGTASGGAPSARIAMYKACFSGLCDTADVLAAMNDAIADGVDILSLSLHSGTLDYRTSGMAIAAFHAVQKGIVVTSSAGNDGRDGYGTVRNVAPWMLTVGASTQNRVFESVVELSSTERSPLSVSGVAINTFTMNATYPIIYISDPTDVSGNEIAGKIVASSKLLPDSTAAGVLSITADDQSVQFNYPLLPHTNVDRDTGRAIIEYINTTRNPSGFIHKTRSAYNLTRGPVMAWFSSIGPNLNTLQILKPDITAPGVDILAAWVPVASDNDREATNFGIYSGTSMATPHAAGVAAIVKSVHPDWSPASIKSAIMTTATPLAPLEPSSSFGSSSVAGNSPIASGSGQINASRAADPGLVLNITTRDYVDFMCAIGYSPSDISLISGIAHPCSEEPGTVLDLNYPSIYLSASFVVGASQSITRRVTNVGPNAGPVEYSVRIESPAVLDIEVSPATLQFSDVNEELPFTVTVTVKAQLCDYTFGFIVWTDAGGHTVSIPVGAGPDLEARC